jgi:Bacterial regulatory proteins, luxR family
MSGCAALITPLDDCWREPRACANTHPGDELRTFRGPVDGREDKAGVMSDHVLEPAAQEFADATAKPPFLYELGPEGARKVLDDVQALSAAVYVGRCNHTGALDDTAPAAFAAGRAALDEGSLQRPVDHLMFALAARLVGGSGNAIGEARQAIDVVKAHVSAGDPTGWSWLAAWSGDEDETTRLVSGALRDGETRGEGRLTALAGYSTAVLNNGLGGYQIALHSACSAYEYEDLGIFGRVLIELIEAAARSGENAKAVSALEKLRQRTVPSGTHWALGMLARSQALLCADRLAEEFHRKAIEHLQQTRLAPHTARAHLLYGEWLRRQRRPTDAREPLRSAHQMFRQMGAKAFAERARRELLATGEQTRNQPSTAGKALSPQERHIAQLAATGLTNGEIAAQLFISAHTVE